MSIKLLFFTVACLVLSRPILSASGSYINRLPTPGVAAKSQLDREKFGLGQKVFNSSIKLDANEPADPQREKLKLLQAKLPASVAAKKNLLELAGRLTPTELVALDYFINQRYPSKQLL